MRNEKTVTTAESGQCVIIMDCVVGDGKTVTTAESGQCVIIMSAVGSSDKDRHYVNLVCN